MKTRTKKDFEEYLNSYCILVRKPTHTRLTFTRYGSWYRRNNPDEFAKEYNEWKTNHGRA